MKSKNRLATFLEKSKTQKQVVMINSQNHSIGEGRVEESIYQVQNTDNGDQN